MRSEWTEATGFRGMIRRQNETGPRQKTIGTAGRRDKKYPSNPGRDSLMSAPHHRLPRSPLLLLLVGLALFPGCRRAKPAISPEQVEAATTRNNPGSESEKTPSMATASPQVEKAASLATIPPPHALKKELPSIGSGNFNGSREPLVFGNPEIVVLGVSPDRRFVVAALRVSRRGASLRAWDVAANAIAFEKHEPLGITSLAFHPNGESFVYGAGDHQVIMQTLPAGATARWSGHRQSIGALAFSPDGSQIASFGNDGRLLVWEISSGNVLAEAFEPNSRFALDVHFANAGKLWTRGSEPVVRWYNWQNSALVQFSEIPLPADFQVLLASTGRLFGVRSRSHVAALDAESGKELWSIGLMEAIKESAGEVTTERQDQALRSAAWAVADQSDELVCLSTDGTLTCFSAASGDQQRLTSGTQHGRRLAGDPTGRLWAIGGAGSSLMIVDREHPDSLKRLEQGVSVDPYELAVPRFDSSRTQLISLKNGTTIDVSDLATGLRRQRFLRPTHKDGNATTAFAICGNLETVFCGTTNGVIEVYQMGSADKPRVLTVGDGDILALAVAPQGDWLVAGDSQGTTVWIDIATWQVKHKTEGGSTVRAMAWSPDGGRLATARSDHAVELWDAANQAIPRILAGHQQPVSSIAFSPDSQSLASGDATGELIRWEVTTGKRLTTYAFRKGLVSAPASPERNSLNAQMQIEALAFSPDQSVLAAGTLGGYTQTFQVDSGAELSPIFQQAPVTDLDFSDDGTRLRVATQAGDVSAWWRAPDAPRLLRGHEGSVRFAALDATGQRAVTGGVDRHLRVWDVAQQSLTHSLENAGEAIAGGALSSDGRRAVTGGYGSGIMLWDLGDMKSLGKRYGHKKRVWAFDFAPDGERFATGSDDQTVRVWEFSSQKTIRTIELDSPVRFVRFSPDGTSLATATVDPRGWQFPGRLQLWSLPSGKLVTELRGHEVAVNAAVFSPDGKELTSCDANGIVTCWNAITGELLKSLSRPFGLSHAGTVGSRDLIAMRRFSNGILLVKNGTLTPLSEFDVPTRSIGDLNVASRGNRIIAGTEEGAVFVWSLDNE